MSGDTTSLNSLPSQMSSMQNIALNNNPHHQQNVQMVIQENSMGRTQTNNDKRLNADDINSLIRDMGGADTTMYSQPSQIPQSSSLKSNTQFQGQNTMYTPINEQSQSQSQMNGMGIPTQGTIGQNDLGPLMSSLNQLTNNQSGVTSIPIHAFSPENGNGYMDPNVQINNIGNNQWNQHDAMLRRMHENDMVYQNNASGNPYERKSFYQHWFNELKIPLLICCLFFIFQLPFYRQNLHKHFEFLFHNDGNMNIYGYLASSLLFSIGYYALNKMVK